MKPLESGDAVTGKSRTEFPLLREGVIYTGQGASISVTVRPIQVDVRQ